MATTEAVWNLLKDDLRRFIRRRVASDDVADDLLQETFLRIHKNIHSVRDGERLVAWVYRIARNVTTDYYRTAKLESLEDGDLASPTEDKAELVANAHRWLDELVDELPEQFREPIRLSELQELPHKEVAKQLGLSLSATKSRIQRGRALLKKILNACCEFHFDHLGNVIDCDPRPGRTACIDCDGTPD